MTGNPFEATARLKKASKLLAVLDSVAPGGRITAYGVRKLSDRDWAGASMIVGCKPPSEATRAVVAQMAADRDAVTAEIAEVIR